MSRVLIVLIACGKKEIAVKNAARYPKAINFITVVQTPSLFVGLVRFEPITMDELSKVKGIDPNKLNQYGEEIIELVKKYL